MRLLLWYVFQTHGFTFLDNEWVQGGYTVCFSDHKPGHVSDSGDRWAKSRNILYVLTGAWLYVKGQWLLVRGQWFIREQVFFLQLKGCQTFLYFRGLHFPTWEGGASSRQGGLHWKFDLWQGCLVKILISGKISVLQERTVGLSENPILKNEIIKYLVNGMSVCRNI